MKASIGVKPGKRRSGEAVRIQTQSLCLNEPMDLPTFATLNNRKLAMPGFDGQCVIVEQHFFAQLLTASIATIYIDEVWYRKNYPDVAKILGGGAFKTAKDHYIKFGYFEHRMPYQILVDEKWYATAYEDVGAAVHRGDFVSGQDHFNQMGFSEGRLPFANFELRRG